MLSARSKFLAVVSGFLIVALVPGLAWAPKIFRRQTIFGATCTVANQSGVFAGGIEVTRLSQSDGVISATGVMDGNCDVGETWIDLPMGETVSLAGTVGRADCEEFRLDVDRTLALSNMTVTMSIDIIIQAPDKGARRLCRVADLLDSGGIEGAVRLLNTLLAQGQKDDTRHLEPK